MGCREGFAALSDGRDCSLMCDPCLVFCREVYVRTSRFLINCISYLVCLRKREDYGWAAKFCLIQKADGAFGEERGLDVIMK